jgi:hypothetical protein
MANRSLIAGQCSGNNDENKNKLETKIDGRIHKNINFLTVQKMINRFLTRDRVVKKEIRCLKYTEWELAEKLNITPEALKRLKLPCFYKATIRRVILPLVCLYCSTKWADGEDKGK